MSGWGLPYRHFKRSEKSLLFAVKRMISEKRKRETCSPQTFGHRLYKKIGAKRRTTTLKFECRDEWLGIRDWGLGVTGILRHRHPERSRGIFTALRESVCMRRGKTMSWCCLISGDERSAIKIEGYARNDDAREALSKLHGASIFLCAATFIPNSSFEQSFHLRSRDNTSRGLPPNPEP